MRDRDPPPRAVPNFVVGQPLLDVSRRQLFEAQGTEGRHEEPVDRRAIAPLRAGSPAVMVGLELLTLTEN